MIKSSTCSNSQYILGGIHLNDYRDIKALFQITEPCGFTQAELSSITQKYGPIPAVLYDYYATLGAHDSLNNSQDFLIQPQDLPDYETLDYFVFYSENQGVCAWGIQKTDMELDDPPVYENYDTDEWHPTSDHLSEFLLSMGYLQAVFALPYSNEEYLPATAEQVQQLAAHFASKHAECGLYTGVRFLGDHSDSVIVIMNDHDQYGVMFSSGSEEHFEEMEAVVYSIID